MSVTYRVRGPSGQATLAGLSPDMRLSDFLALLSDKTGVAVGQQEIMAGFPPKVVDLPADADVHVLSSLPFANGDSLTVRQLPGQPSLQPPPPPPQVNGNGTSPAPSTAQPAAAPTFLPTSLNSIQGYGGSNDHDDDPELAAAIAASLAETAKTHPGIAAAAAARPTASNTSQPQPRQQQHSYSHPPAATQHDTASSAPAAGPAPTHIAMPDGGAVTRRVIASDNSCLFNAVGYVMEGSRSRAPALRQLIASAVSADPFTYNDGFLGKANEDYCRWILQSDKWGGAIELSILCKHYGREIAAYDIQTKRCDIYGQDAGYTERVMLIYDGLHYDALAVAAFEGAPEELDVTIYEPASSTAPHIQAAAAKLVEACSKARQFTDTATFTLRCGVCQVGLKGDKEAVEHAKATGHQNFAEY